MRQLLLNTKTKYCYDFNKISQVPSKLIILIESLKIEINNWNY